VGGVEVSLMTQTSAENADGFFLDDENPLLS
jgi:hypothetical protein